MILRRLTEHVRAQNWFAVALDFFIVLAGILIAFQITAWADRRADRRSLNVALERLHEEIEANIAAIDTFSGRHGEIMAAGEALLQQVHDPELDTVPEELLAKVFIGGFTTDYSTSALMAVLGQQTFQGMRSNELRPTISALPAEYLDAMEDELTVIQLVDGTWIPYISQELPVGLLWVLAYKDTEWEADFASALEANDYEPISLAAFKELASTLRFQNQVVNRTEYERMILIEQRELRAVLEKALILIEEETG